MVAGTGEAPSGIIAYESDGLPKDYIGDFLVTSWGEHRIGRFRLKPRGTSFQSLADPVIQGGESFRPVGLAVAPDGSLYCTDWVLKDYKIHEKGRVWHISVVNLPKRRVIDSATITTKHSIGELTTFLNSPRLDVRRVSAKALTKSSSGRKQLLAIIRDEKQPARQRIEVLWALAKLRIGAAEYRILRDNAEKSIETKNPDDVDIAAIRLLGSSQFTFDTAKEHKLHKDLTYNALVRAVFRDSAITDSSSRRWLASIPIFPSMDTFLALEFKAPFISATVIERLAARKITRDQLMGVMKLIKDFEGESDDWTAKHQLLSVILAARKKYPQLQAITEVGIKDSDPTIRRAAVQWVAEEKLTKLRPQVEAILNDKVMTTDLFLATLAALEMLDGKGPQDFDRTPAAKYVLPLVRDKNRSPAVRAQALRLVDPNDPALDAELFRTLLNSAHAQLKLETVRTLQHSTLKGRDELLAAVLADQKNGLDLRAEAVVRLGTGGDLLPEVRRLLLQMLAG